VDFYLNRKSIEKQDQLNSLSNEDLPEYNERTTKQKKKEKIGYENIGRNLKKGKTEDKVNEKKTLKEELTHSDSIVFDSGRENHDILGVPKPQNIKKKRSKSSHPTSGFDSYMENSESNVISNEASILKDPP